MLKMKEWMGIGDRYVAPLPLVLGSMDPSTSAAFSAIVLQVYGSGFTPSSRIIFDGVGRTTIFANESQQHGRTAGKVAGLRQRG